MAYNIASLLNNLFGRLYVPLIIRRLDWRALLNESAMRQGMRMLTGAAGLTHALSDDSYEFSPRRIPIQS